MTALPRLRQVVLAARDLDAVAGGLRAELGLGEPYADPGVGHFGLRNAVFALGDTFLEVVSPIRPDTAAGRLLDKRGGDCGYMLMFQVEDLAAARERARTLGIREVFEVSLDDVAEVHLHPADMRGAIVSLTATNPPGSWRWGGPGWETRAAPLSVSGATVAVSEATARRWQTVIGGRAGIRFTPDHAEPGLTEVLVDAAESRDPDQIGSLNPHAPLEIGGVRFVFTNSKEDR